MKEAVVSFGFARHFVPEQGPRCCGDAAGVIGLAGRGKRQKRPAQVIAEFHQVFRDIRGHLIRHGCARKHIRFRHTSLRSLGRRRLGPNKINVVAQPQTQGQQLALSAVGDSGLTAGIAGRGKPAQITSG